MILSCCPPLSHQGAVNMEIKLGKDELAIMKWIYGRARGFGKENGYWANVLKKELSMTEERYKRATSLLRELSLAGTQSGKIDRPQPEQGEWIWLTGEGVNAYRSAVPQEEWDIVY